MQCDAMLGSTANVARYEEYPMPAKRSQLLIIICFKTESNRIGREIISIFALFGK